MPNRNVQFSMDDFEKELVDQTRNALNMTISEFWTMCFVFYCDHHKIKISQATRMKCQKLQVREMNREFYFFKNALQALYMQIEWQLRLKHQTYNIDMAVVTVKKYLDMYESLPEDTRKLLKSDRDEFAKLMDREFLELHVAKIQPASIKKLVYKG